MAPQYNAHLGPGAYRHQILRGEENPLKKGVRLSATETLATHGRVGHIDPTTGDFVIGLPGNEFPLFCIDSQYNYDAGGSGTHPTAGFNTTQYGNKTFETLVMSGGFEVQSPAFVEGVYPPQTPLTVSNGDGMDDEADRGKVKAGEFYEDTVVGVVSGGDLDGGGNPTVGRFTNEFHADILQYWTYFLPAWDSSLAQ